MQAPDEDDGSPGPLISTSSIAVNRVDEPTVCGITSRPVASPRGQQLVDTVAGSVAKNGKFQSFTLLVIVGNALWIVVDVQWNHSNLKDENDALPFGVCAKVVENLFCFFFFFEIVVRFLAYARKLDCILDPWFVFDGLLAFLMVLETWVLEFVGFVGGWNGSDGLLSNFSSLRLLRLLRLTRIAKIVRYLPEIMTLVKGMVAAVSAVSWVLLFMALFMYVFAILFTSSIASPGASESDIDAFRMFASMGDSLMTLFTNGVLGDNLAQAIEAILEIPQDGLWLFWMFSVFLMICGITLMNLLIGVLCQVIDTTARAEEEEEKSNSLRKAFMRAHFEMDKGGENPAMTVSAADWDGIQRAPMVREAVGALRDAAGRRISDDNLDLRLQQMHEAVFGDSTCAERVADGLMGLDEFANKVGALRADTAASPLEVALLRKACLVHARTVTRHLDAVEIELLKVLDRRKRRGAAAAGGGKPSRATAVGSSSACSGDACSPRGAPGFKSLTQQQRVPKTGDAFLASVPTELLLHELSSRGPRIGPDHMPYPCFAPNFVEDASDHAGSGTCVGGDISTAFARSELQGRGGTGNCRHMDAASAASSMEVEDLL